MYTVTVEEADNGSISVSDTSAEKGSQVTVMAKPDKGFVLNKITVTDKNGSEAELVREDDNRYTFSMPASRVTVEAVFTEPFDDMPFTDVAGGAWYHGAVKYVYDSGIMNGVEEDIFGPNVGLTRGMTVTILYRMEGEPDAGISSFDDVDPSEYYADAVAWAFENGNAHFAKHFLTNGDLRAQILRRFCAPRGNILKNRCNITKTGAVNQK